MSDFKIEGPGFYRMRNCERAEVFAIRGTFAFGMTDTLHEMCWTLDGRACKGALKDYPLDLVSVWRAVPGEPWTPTCELRWKTRNGRDETSLWTAKGTWGRLEQKWTRGDKSEWRPVEVVT